jgi:ketosteroid isomerase-like protein
VPYRNLADRICMRDGQIAEIVEHCDTALVERVLDPPAQRHR